MFTGIITDIGEVIFCERKDGDTHLRIKTTYDLQSVALGASIACSGICLTVTEKGEGWFAVTASAETGGITNLSQWQIGTRVNLERALKMGDELGGHLVSGHVDGLATLDSVESIGESYKITFLSPPELSRYIARKGSVAIDGISLTVNEVKGDRFAVMIIPHSWANTTLAQRKVGEKLNLEVDLAARHLERLFAPPHNHKPIKGDKPPRIAPRIKAAPKIRQLYWCDFPEDAQLPEFWKRRPVIILSYRNTLHGTVTVIPCSSLLQDHNPWAYPLNNRIDERKSWAICNYITSVATSRLLPSQSVVTRISQAEFSEILKIIGQWLPQR